MATSYVDRNTSYSWVEHFLKDLKTAHKPSSVAYYLGNDMEMSQFRFINYKSDIQKLNLELVENKFLKSNRCLIFMDHEIIPTAEFGYQQL
mmetsp:Transcript_40690/g.39295  ORF Transcript_40690/g.39295 Transcript_40690/m.39295 type:complete len:91 (+) Transcript_40690:2148-2420(+)